MKKHIQTQAFFIHRFPALASGITPVLLLTQELGLVRVMVKGLQNAKSALASRMDPLLLLDVQLYVLDEHAFLLTQAAIAQRFGDYSRFSYEQIEVIWRLLSALHTILPTAVPHPEVMDLMSDFLHLLQNAKQPRILESMALFKLLHMLGYVDVHASCMHCHCDTKSDTQVFLRTEDMLLVCQKCVDSMPTAVGLVALQHMTYKTLFLYIQKDLSMSHVVHIPEEIYKAAHHVVLERYRHVSGQML